MGPSLAVTWSLAALAVSALFLALVVALGRRSDRRTWPAWERALLPDDEAACSAFEREVGARLVGVDHALVLARGRLNGDQLDAARVLRQGMLGALRLVRRLDAWLVAWRDAARALAALQPVPTPPVWAFRSWGIRCLAAGQHAWDSVLVGSRARFHAHVRFVRRALGLVRLRLARLARGKWHDMRGIEWRLRGAECARDDLRALAADGLATLRALATSRSSGGGASRH